MSQFQSTLSRYAAQFETDKTYTLIVRLRQNVIKTGIRRLSLSYSRISLRDICVKLHLDSEEDAEYIVGKAIRDGVIEGRIVHEKGWMECGGQKSGYGPEVSDVFSRRIAYCLELHNQSVKVRELLPWFPGYVLLPCTPGPYCLLLGRLILLASWRVVGAILKVDGPSNRGAFLLVISEGQVTSNCALRAYSTGMQSSYGRCMQFSFYRESFQPALKVPHGDLH